MQSAKVKEDVMTIEQQIRLEGRREGALIGRIQTCQELLNLPLIGVEEFGQRTSEEMESLLRELKAQCAIVCALRRPRLF